MSTRAALRLLLLKVTRSPLLSPPLPERDFDPTMLPTSSTESLAPSSSSASLPTIPDHLKNNHVPLPPHPLLTLSFPPMQSDTAVEDFLLPKALTTISVKPSLSLLKNLSSPQEWLAEIVHILRPLVYGTFCALVSWLQILSLFDFSIPARMWSLEKTVHKSSPDDSPSYGVDFP